MNLQIRFPVYVAAGAVEATQILVVQIVNTILAKSISIFS